MIQYARAARLKTIEWHGLNHVVHGDVKAARRIGEATVEAGLGVAAYGSYYVLGESERRGLSFSDVLLSAKALGARMVRVWAGNRSPDEASTRFREQISDEARRIADLAAEAGIQLVFEFHQGSLTQTGESCAALMEAVDHCNARAYWQPAPELDVNQNLDQLRCVLPWLVGLHVFHWKPTDLDRHPLAQGELEWARYLDFAGQHHDSLDVLLEFVKGDSVEQFHKDAATLHRLLAHRTIV
ncbi:Xylose isomerase-like TIM barrel [Novipirellula aureliae]|uniref:Xylose isomerase-like TIM barrel n=1 Tax=Novipirellula aureliae TaxID=2527966 RepID=A0A5C6DK36_9BACT|nr:TIM barrel protein [Novipirellula aureliae]TWU36474.1 Xylose isomerase-like TIM barrel [Novipirellula aureliae]